MSEPRRRSREGWIWGSLLVVSLLGGVIAFTQWVERGDAAAPPEPLALDQPGMPFGPAEDLPSAPPLPDGFVPDLPPVPTLASGARPSRGAGAQATDDERLDELAAEMRLLQEARGILGAVESDRDPAAALALLDQHRQRYPQGALAEEREVYSIEALLLLGQDDQVERRFVEFREDYPDSTFLERLERAMQ
ncbi:MAG: hypothetical protein M3Y87_13805 [Myxococcota bacterium]|nr:hypothetical protein [Myxococcota bacterium]